MGAKSGITMASLVIYVILLTAFTGIALIVSNNLSISLFEDKGAAINTTSYDRIQYYLNKSAIESSTVNVNGADVTFSNGDTFSYNTETDELSMNGGILCKDVYGFSAVKLESGILSVTLNLKKYTHNMERTITLFVGE